MARSARRRRSSGTSKGSLWLGGGLIAAAILCAGGLAYGYFITPAPIALDKESLCPVDGSRSVTAVLVDTSDDLPPITKQEVTKLLLDIAENLPPYELFDVRVLDAEHQTSRSVFARCNPGDGKGLSEWTANPILARKRWVESFRAPVAEALSGSLSAPNAKTSPIMAAIQNIAVDRFTGRTAAKGSRKLVVVSDMIEYEPDYSQYVGDLSFERYKNSLAYLKYRTDLHGADIAIEYVQRLTRKPINSVAHVRFWTDWFSDSNGQVREIVRLQGAGR